MSSRYPHGGLHVVVITKEEEERAPHPGVSTGELVRRLRETLLLYQQKRLTHLAMPGSGAQAAPAQLGRCGLREILGEDLDPARVFVGVSDADSIPDPETYRWIAQEEPAGPGALAYQGITLSLANYGRQAIRGKICAIQQSSIFIRVSIARLISEVKRVRLFAVLLVPGSRAAASSRLRADVPPLADLPRAQPVRAPRHARVVGPPFPRRHRGLTLGYALGRRGIRSRGAPHAHGPAGDEKVIQRECRWYLGVLQDISFLWRTWRAEPTAFNLAQLLRHANKVVGRRSRVSGDGLRLLESPIRIAGVS